MLLRCGGCPSGAAHFARFDRLSFTTRRRLLGKYWKRGALLCEPWDPEAWSGDDYFVLRVISWRGRAQANARAPKAQKIDACGARGRPKNRRLRRQGEKSVVNA